MRSKLAVLGFLLILVWVNGQIVLRERAISGGTTVLLQLEPLDPRSLMQGDYMQLRYAIADKVPAESSGGTIQLRLGERGLVEGVDEQPFTGSVPLRYRRHNGQVKFEVETYLFQEGLAAEYERAAYAELRVTPEGIPHLVGLLDHDFRPLGERR